MRQSEIKNLAKTIGFTVCGIAPAERIAPWREQEIRQFIAENRHGTMTYLSDRMEQRLHPDSVLPGVKSVISVALTYASPEEQALPLARYARGKDYHDVMKQRLRQFATCLFANTAVVEGVDFRVCCDTAPLDEKYWAWRSGLGFLGRNTQLIIPNMGSYFFLGELLTTFEVDRYDEPMQQKCPEACHNCLNNCPTGALLGDGTMDARKCLSYLTIEYRGPLPEGTGEKMGECFYGCDRCSECCPFNAQKNIEKIGGFNEEFQPSEALSAMSKEDWRHLTVEQYRMLFKGSAVKRAKYEGLMRNISAISQQDERVE